MNGRTLFLLFLLPVLICDAADNTTSLIDVYYRDHSTNASVRLTENTTAIFLDALDVATKRFNVMFIVPHMCEYARRTLRNTNHERYRLVFVHEEDKSAFEAAVGKDLAAFSLEDKGSEHGVVVSVNVVPPPSPWIKFLVFVFFVLGCFFIGLAINRSENQEHFKKTRRMIDYVYKIK